MKQLTGGDRIKARFMRQDFFEFEPSHTIALAANYRPVVKGTDIAIWRRIHLIPFDVTFPPERQDHELPDKLRTELPGILNWLVQGCLEWQRVGLQPPAEVRAATEGYRDSMDVLGGFIAEHCVLEDGAEVEAKDLYEKYKGWAEVSGERRFPQKQFGRQLQERGFETRKHSRTRRAIYLGIRINTGCEGVRSRPQYEQLETAHVETNVQTPSHGFAGGEQGEVFDA